MKPLRHFSLGSMIIIYRGRFRFRELCLIHNRKKKNMTKTLNPSTDDIPPKVYRILYRVRFAGLPMVGEFDVKTKKEKHEIDFFEIVRARIEKMEGDVTVEAVIDAYEIA